MFCHSENTDLIAVSQLSVLFELVTLASLHHPYLSVNERTAVQCNPHAHARIHSIVTQS